MKPHDRLHRLDALRGWAIIVVLLAHFSHTVQQLTPDLGLAGVRLFFVLSGFLITDLLLSARERVKTGASDPSGELRHFWRSRFYRILPPYLVLLSANYVLDIGSTRPDFAWHALFLSNLPMGLDGAWRDLLTHLWSLAVEQQFYLAWPLIVLAAPARLLPRLLLAITLSGPVFRLVCVTLAPANAIAPVVLTPACFDLLGAGALLAWWRRTHPDALTPAWLRNGLFALPLALLASARAPDALQTAQLVLVPTLQAWVFSALVLGASRGFQGPFDRLLTFSPLVRLGLVSYSLYLFHNNAHWLGPRLLRQLTDYRMAYFQNEVLHVAYLSALSLLAAIASWFVIERPCQRFKLRAPRHTI